jgi:hypothetical protein
VSGLYAVFASSPPVPQTSDGSGDVVIAAWVVGLLLVGAVAVIAGLLLGRYVNRRAWRLRAKHFAEKLDQDEGFARSIHERGHRPEE